MWNLLLQILEDGKLTDNTGHVVNFRNTIILMTSNVGSDTIKRQSTVFLAHHGRKQLREDARTDFGRGQADVPPEFLNRLDDVIVFRSFTKPDLIQILTLESDKVVERLCTTKTSSSSSTIRRRTFSCGERL